MIKKYYSLDIIFKTEIETNELTETGNRYLHYIDRFINEFVKDPHAVLTFYKIYLMGHLNTESAIYEKLRDILGVDVSDAYYLRMADNCEPEVRDFIQGLFGDRWIKGMDYSDREKYQKILEERFKDLIIIDASFKEITPTAI